MISGRNALEAASFLGQQQNSLAAMAAGAAKKTARKRIWDLSAHYHCSIIGTCLSAGELRKLLVKLDLAATGDSDHDLHGRGVGLALRQDLAGKLLNKALDERHQVSIKRYGRAKCEVELRALWQEDVRAGDIPGGYWAVMTHPLAGSDLVREVFGYVHMLSHLVGAANRADIRRLQQLEAQNSELTEKLERQQSQIFELTAARDAALRQVREDFSPRIAVPAVPEDGEDREIAGLRRQLEAETSRRALAEERLAQSQAAAGRAQDAAREAGQRAAALQAELDAVERGLRTGAETPADTVAPMTLDGLTLLYVGGRPTQMPHIRQAAAERGGKLLHHDGGIEDNDLLLASMVSRADIIFFPVDCVSHGAVGTVKRTCRSEGKKYIPLRSAAVTSFIAGLGA